MKTDRPPTDVIASVLYGHLYEMRHNAAALAYRWCQMADYMTELHLDFPADEDHEAFVKMVNNELEVLNTILAWAARDKASENYNTEQFRRDTQRELEDVLRRVQRTLMLRLNS